MAHPRTRRRLAALAVLAPILGGSFLACAPRAPTTTAPDDGWTPRLAPVTTPDAAEPAPFDAAVRLADQLADASVEELTDAVRQRTKVVGPHRWRVERQAFDLLFLHDGALMARSFRIVPEVRDGSVAGMRVFGVRQNGLGGLLGLLNGDRIEAVNGRPVARPEEAKAIVDEVQRAPRVEVSVVRAGKPLTLTYDVVDP